jgi:molecular chaperone GrpE
MKKHIPINDASDKENKNHEKKSETEAATEKTEIPHEEKTNDDAAAKTAEEAPAKPTEAELLDQLQRLAAEFDNYRKKNAREYSRGYDDGISRSVETILPTLESLQLAVQSAKGKTEGGSVVDGIEAIRKQLLSRLESLGVKSIEAKEGDALDPKVHEVLWTEPSDTAPAGTVLGLVQAGYSINGRIIAPAKVKVAKEPVTQEIETSN